MSPPGVTQRLAGPQTGLSKTTLHGTGGLGGASDGGVVDGGSVTDVFLGVASTVIGVPSSASRPSVMRSNPGVVVTFAVARAVRPPGFSVLRGPWTTPRPA